MTTRARVRPAALVRKVLLPPVLAGAAAACLLGALALTAANGARGNAGNPLASGRDRGLAVALSVDLEGMPAPADIRRARRPFDERRRMLAKHPCFDLYALAQRRFGLPWVLVASVHYQETGFAKARSRRAARRLVMAIAAQLHAARARDGLGRAATRAVARRYASDPEGRVSTAMVIERARAWRLLGTIPLPGRGELATPVAGVVGGCGYFGCPRPGHLHNGVDFLAPSGTPVRSVDDGVVALVETTAESGGYGNFVCVQHRPHLASCYAHLSAVAAGVRAGFRVRRGQVVGLVGTTGSSSAPHLHFEARRGPAACQGCAVDPLPLLSGEVPQSTVAKLLPRASAAPAPVAARAPAVRPAAPAAAPRAPAARAPAARAPAKPTEPVAPRSSCAPACNPAAHDEPSPTARARPPVIADPPDPPAPQAPPDAAAPPAPPEVTAPPTVPPTDPPAPPG